MRTHPVVATAVVAAAITTMTVFGQSVPLPAPVKKLHRPAAAARPAASSAVPAWLAAPAAAKVEHGR
jgi:hypothetical protein